MPFSQNSHRNHEVTTFKEFNPEKNINAEAFQGVFLRYTNQYPSISVSSTLTVR